MRSLFLLAVVALVALGLAVASSDHDTADTWEEDAELLDAEHGHKNVAKLNNEDGVQSGEHHKQKLADEQTAEMVQRETIEGAGLQSSNVKEKTDSAQGGYGKKHAAKRDTDQGGNNRFKQASGPKKVLFACKIMAAKMITAESMKGPGGRRLLGNGKGQALQEVVVKSKAKVTVVRNKYVTCCVAEAVCRSKAKDIGAKSPSKLIQMIEADAADSGRRLLGGASRRRVITNDEQGMKMKMRQEQQRAKNRQRVKAMSLKATQVAAAAAAEKTTDPKKKAVLEKVAAAASAMMKLQEQCMADNLPKDYVKQGIGHC